MPRQKLPPNLYKGPWSLGPHDIEGRPEHVAGIGRCLTLWPSVDHQLAMILGALLGSDPEGAVAVFSLVRRFGTQREMIEAAAQPKLSQDDFEFLQAALIVAGAASKERDALAHGQWGISTELPNAVLWIEAKHVTPWNMEMLIKETRPDRRTGKEHAELARFIYVYTLDDLKAVQAHINEAWHLLFNFLAFIRWTLNSTVMPTLDRGYFIRRLEDSPRFRDALASIQVGKKNILTAE